MLRIEYWDPITCSYQPEKTGIEVVTYDPHFHAEWAAGSEPRCYPGSFRNLVSDALTNIGRTETGKLILTGLANAIQSGKQVQIFLSGYISGNFIKSDDDEDPRDMVVVAQELLSGEKVPGSDTRQALTTCYNSSDSTILSRHLMYDIFAHDKKS